MTRDDIIRMAHEAGILEYGYPVGERVAGELERFADLVAAAEREACAKVCEDQASASMQASNKAKLVRDSESYRSAAIGAKFCIDRIRARSTP